MHLREVTMMRREITFVGYLLGSVRGDNTILVLPGQIIKPKKLQAIQWPDETTVILHLAPRKRERSFFISAWRRMLQEAARLSLADPKDGFEYPELRLTAVFEVSKSAETLPLHGTLVPLAVSDGDE
jgi:hypothetical protein